MSKDKTFTPDELLVKAKEYFKWNDENPLTKPELIKYKDSYEIIDFPCPRVLSLERFSLFAKITYQTFLNYEKEEDYFEVTSFIRKTIETQQFEGATAGFFAQNIIARKLALVDRVENNINEIKPITFIELANDKRDKRTSGEI